ncbi:MAG: SDR family oxidoreductase [Flavobacteriaceae bacterium]|nr:SDR family oxidoreductase [Flavobacteriaceae bacterium]
MKILIIGATGKTGKQLVQQGLEQGHTVSALCRNPGKLKINHPRLRVLQGNVLEASSLVSAVEGQEAVISALGHKRFILPSNILSEGSINLIRIMEAQQVNRLICITSLGIADSRYRLGLYYTLFVIPVILFFYFRDKEKQEMAIRQSKLEWTIVRPGQLTNGKQRAVYKTGPGLGHALFTRMVSRATVAAFILKELGQRKYIRQVSGITH